MIFTRETLARKIEYTLLKPTVTQQMIEVLCDEALQYGFACVAVNPYWVSLCAQRLKSSTVGICTGIGFPLGASTTSNKITEAQEALLEGATDIDVVINIGRAKEGNWRMVTDELARVVRAIKPKGIAKIIIEACYLTEEEKIAACHAALESGADYVKTSTGFGTAGATPEDVALIYREVHGRARIKAAGGIKTLEDALTLINAGADRIGTSSGVSIIQQLTV